VPKELDKTWQLLDDFADAARVLHSFTSSTDVAETVCELAVKVVGGDHASVTNVRSGELTTVAATSDVPVQADKIQSKVGSGPCLDAVLGSDTIRVDDLATDRRWTEFGTAACAELGMHSMLAQVLHTEDHALTSVNIYSARPHAFNGQTETVIALFGSAAVAALSAAQHQERADHLERALHTSRRIGVALGILMATRDVDIDQAWELLVKASQDSNTKVSELADRVVQMGSLAAPEGADTPTA
jgi:hypothetical protein